MCPVRTQAVQSRHRQQHDDPHRLGHPLFQENAENGHQHDVKGGDEARLAGRGGVQTLLLKEGEARPSVRPHQKPPSSRSFRERVTEAACPFRRRPDRMTAHSTSKNTKAITDRAALKASGGTCSAPPLWAKRRCPRSKPSEPHRRTNAENPASYTCSSPPDVV